MRTNFFETGKLGRFDKLERKTKWFDWSQLTNLQNSHNSYVPVHGTIEGAHHVKKAVIEKAG